MKFFASIFPFAIFLLMSIPSQGTHLRASTLHVEQVNCPSLTYKITLTVYLNSVSRTPFGGNNLSDGHISFGDGTVVQIPETSAEFRPDLGKDISVATFTVIHTFPSHGNYKINYFERDRSSGVLNIPNSGDVAYSASTTINTVVSCNKFPFLSIPPLDRACSGKAFFHVPGAVDPDGDSLSYELTVPSRDANSTVSGYVDPNNQRFYANYNTGNEARNGQPTFGINAVTGLITFDAPGMVGEYNIAFKIIEWRKDPLTEESTILSVTVRDMQIVVEDCPNQRPDVIVPADICVEAGTILNFSIFGVDPDKDPVKIEAVSEIFSLPENKIPAVLSPAISLFVPSDPQATVNFLWRTDCIHVREQSYQVVFKITDQPQRGISLVTYKSWTIKIIAPAPDLQAPTLDLIHRAAILEWAPYTCTNAEKIQVWRRVGSFNYGPGACDSGLPKSLGYKLIAELNPDENSFTDTNGGTELVVGAQYCYRLVAAFSLPAGGKSYTSVEVCVGPIRADAPVITHVTVDKTDNKNGSTRVSWRSPFNIDPEQFIRPYQYHIYRADGFSGDTLLHKIAQVVDDTTFVDAGLNTHEKVFNYRIVLYSRTANSELYIPVDTSAVASMVRLHAYPGQKEISLSWGAEVPWSSVVQQSPYHYIYRSAEGVPESQMTLIDSVDVSLMDMTYFDLGKYKNQLIQDDEIYCYRVMTQGTYGNPAIALQKNFSQRVCLYPENKLLPCVPVVTIASPDCDSFIRSAACDAKDLSNSFSWHLPDEKGCRHDITSYQIYALNDASGEFELLATMESDTVFFDKGLDAFAKCYKVAAIDGLGQVSDLSEEACNDNCPYYELPNVFTPNDDGYNDTFIAYGLHDDSESDENQPGLCPRFVNKVTFSVYSRWGKKVYSYESLENDSIYINWDGRDDNGKLLESAIYFFVADVTFQVFDPEKKNKSYKGWVHLIR